MPAATEVGDRSRRRGLARRSASATLLARRGSRRRGTGPEAVPFRAPRPRLPSARTAALVLLFFFFIPAFRALIQAFQLADPFGGFDPVGRPRQPPRPCSASAPYWAAVRVDDRVHARPERHHARRRAAPRLRGPSRPARPGRLQDPDPHPLRRSPPQSPASSGPSCSTRRSARSRIFSTPPASPGTRTAIPAMP